MDPLLDRLLPRPEVAERHRIEVTHRGWNTAGTLAV
jgi:hypothetical protein